jgi:GT2 family glycosyltransferase
MNGGSRIVNFELRKCGTPLQSEVRNPTPEITSYDPSIPVSAIVVNWNGREHLDLCLTSLLRQSLRNVEFILVDNASSDGSVGFVRERFGERVRVIEKSQNAGYGTALNSGIRAARGRYLMALNNDVEVDAGCLEALVEAADRHPNAGFCSPKILSHSNRRIIDNVGHSLYPDGLSRGRGRLEEDRGQFDNEEEILLPSGCAVLMRRAMLADVGLFDEDLFAYCEDTDLGLRARLAGWSCRYIPSAVVYHKYSASSANYSPFKAFLVERNRAWVALKCLPMPMLLTSPVFTLIRYLGQAAAGLTRRGAAGRFVRSYSAIALAAVLIRAMLAALSGARHAWSKRRTVQSRRRIHSVDALLWVARHGMGVREIAWKD